MASLFAITEQPKPGQMAVYYISADTAEEAAKIAEEYRQEHGITWDRELVPLPNLNPEELHLEKGDIQRWPVGEPLNPLKLTEPLGPPPAKDQQ